MRVLYDLIHAKASVSFGEPITNESFKRYQVHWCRCARALQELMTAEGLHETAKAVGEIAAFEEKTL